MIRFAFTYVLLILLLVGCQSVTHTPQTSGIVQSPQQAPAKKLWSRTAQLFQPLLPDANNKHAGTENQLALRQTNADILSVNNNSHSLYKAGSIFPSAALFETQNTPETSVQAEITRSNSLPKEKTAASPINPLKIQTGDSETFKRLLREIAVVPSEERKVNDTQLAELLTSFRKQTMGTDIEDEYLVLLRKRILPDAEVLESDAPLPEMAIASKKRSANKPVSALDLEYGSEEFEDKPVRQAKRAVSQKEESAVAQTSAQAPIYPSLTQLPSAAPATVQASYTQQHIPQTPITSYGAGDWQAPTRQAIEQLRYAIEHTPNGRSVSNEMRLRMLEMLLGNKAEAAKPMPSADKMVSEFMGHQILGLSALLDDSMSNSRGKYVSAAYRFNEGLIELQKLCPIKLKNVTFVKDWFGFGQYIPHAGEFHPGEEFNLYIEMENPKARAVDGYEVCMAVSYEIRDAQANIVAKQDAGKPLDRSLSRKRDYCLAIPGSFPASLKPGQYQLRISVTDLNDDSMQYAEEQIPFKVAPALGEE